MAVVTGDVGMGYSLMELDTFAKYEVAVICIIYNNDAAGSFTFALEMDTPRPEHLTTTNKYSLRQNCRTTWRPR